MDELRLLPPDIAELQEVAGLNFNVWNPKNPPNLWGVVIDMVKSVGGPPCKCTSLFVSNPTLENRVGHAIFGHKKWREAIYQKWQSY